jgi:hypothetical protein
MSSDLAKFQKQKNIRCRTPWQFCLRTFYAALSPPSESPLNLSRMRENFGFLAVVIKVEARGASQNV